MRLLILRKSKKQKINWMVYILTLLVILSSKTVFFGIMNLQATTILTLMMLLFYNFHIGSKLKITYDTLRIFFIFVSLLAIVSFFYLGDILSGFNSYIGAILLFLEVLSIGFMVVNTIEKKEFIKCYVHILFIISCISLVYFFFVTINRSAVLQMSSVYISGNTRYIALPWYTFGWQTVVDNGYIYDYMFGRNAGIWWEPGAFQGFLLIGLYFLMSYKELFKRKTILISIFLLTLLTTQSTAAYIIILISLVAYGKDYVECFWGGITLSKKRKSTQLLVYFVTIIFIVIIIALILSSGNITDKFSSQNGSYISRTDDLKGTISILAYNPIAGIGLGTTGEAVKSFAISTEAATTLLTVGLYFGIPFMLYYYYRFLAGCNNLFEPKNQLKKGVLYISFTIILMSETLYLLPIYAVFLFCTAKWGKDNHFS